MLFYEQLFYKIILEKNPFTKQYNSLIALQPKKKWYLIKLDDGSLFFFKEDHGDC